LKVPDISRRQRYDDLPEDEQRRGRRPAEPRYRKPSDEAEALFIKAPDGRIVPVAAEDVPTFKATLKWFNEHKGSALSRWPITRVTHFCRRDQLGVKTSRLARRWSCASPKAKRASR
jgi:hypothetical protein